MALDELDGQIKSELSLIEVAYAIIVDHGDIIEFNDLLVQVQEYLGLTETQLESKMARFYTDLNVDGRFISLGENRWGLRIWYPIDSIDEEIITSSEEEDHPKRARKRRKLNVFADDDMIDYNDDDPEDSDLPYDDEDDDYDLSAEDEDEMDEEEAEDLDMILAEEDKDDDDEELGAYASDLSELGDDEVDIPEDDFEEFDDVDEVEEEEEEEEEVEDDEVFDFDEE
ncbi:DNA-directed RNA polymerase subunit delta [Fundicoccus culcitae]|uniref:Probable DNA-directed RNA polymerase subunit delta n=1 Tax=Fundicoccus culcitae TaxID=2969821 RepID=A0ABY5P3B9_9LACT|nr:DNA-directed RNA polymerase subunit delta [Fundicoccus culcitae]UUX33177.1 DNA-directed RNA polymerase subunit delta [Fundicoccus culcitae]